MARDNSKPPSWMTVLKEEPNTEDPLLGWLKGVGKKISGQLVTDIVRDVGAAAAGAGAAHYSTRNVKFDKEETRREVQKFVDKATQAVFKNSVNEFRRRRDEAKARAMIEAEVKRDQQFRQLMRQLGAPGY